MAHNLSEGLHFEPGTRLANKYQVLSKIGHGWEGEVYLIKELATGIERAAKFFFPQRNKKNQAVRFYAKKLHKLRNCSIVIQYYTQERIEVEGYDITFLVSEYVEGQLLSDYLNSCPRKRLPPFQALHLLYDIAKGMEDIHREKEYHGDLHSENVIIQQRGLGYQIKLLDMYYWKSSTASNIQEDVYDLIRLFYDSIGGKKTYSKQSPIVKSIINGNRKTLIAQKFKTAGQLRRYLENLEWD